MSDVYRILREVSKDAAEAKRERDEARAEAERLREARDDAWEQKAQLTTIVVDQRERLERAEAAIARVEALHAKHDDPYCPPPICAECRVDYPCATIRALRGDAS